MFIPKVPKSYMRSFKWGGGSSLSKIGYSFQNDQKILQVQAGFCITDSLSHSMCVENNKCFCARTNLSSTVVESTPVKSLNSP